MQHERLNASGRLPTGQVERQQGGDVLREIEIVQAGKAVARRQADLTCSARSASRRFARRNRSLRYDGRPDRRKPAALPNSSRRLLQAGKLAGSLAGVGLAQSRDANMLLTPTATNTRVLVELHTTVRK